MRRFFRPHRDEDCGQIQYLTAKCVRLAQENAVLERELLVCREREKALRAQMETLALSVCHKEQLYVQLSVRHDQLINTFQQQQEQADLLQQRVLCVLCERCGDGSLLAVQLQQVFSDLQQLQDSDTQLMGLLDELHQEAQLRAARAEVLEKQLHEEAQSKTHLIEELQLQLNSKSLELAELRISHDALKRELCEQRSAHQRTVEELRGENEQSLCKLRETVEQLEWICEQQRRWICCVKRFKECVSGEKESLELQVSRLQVELETVRSRNHSDVQESPAEDHSRWAVEVKTDPQTDTDRWRELNEDLLNTLSTPQGQWGADRHLKPP